MKLFFFILLFITSIQAFCSEPEKITLSTANTVSIKSEIDEMSVSKAASELKVLCEATPKAPLYLILYSPGGSVLAGRNFIDFVKALPCEVHTITFFAASMAYQIVQQLGTRYVVDSGILMSHRAALSGMDGQIPGELVSRVGFFTNYCKELDEDVALRIGSTLDEYQKQIYDELWMSGRQAVSKKHADKIAAPICDSSFSGTEERIVSTFFGNFTAVFDKCPLIIGPIKVEQNKEDVFDFFNVAKVKVRQYL